MKKIVSYMLVLSFILYFPKNVSADDNLLYVEKKTETITSGLTYEYSERLYKSGWKDVHVLTADIKNPNIQIDVLKSTKEHGLKKTVDNLVIENNAIAGINADFFGSGVVTSSMGQIIKNNVVEEAQNYYNGSSNKYAGFFIDKYGNPFIDYLKSTMKLSNASGSIVEIQGKNKVTNFSKPMYFDDTIIKDTSTLDKRRDDLFKIVVENNKVIKKATKKETVDIPKNGFIIVMNENTASKSLHLFNVGDTVSFNEVYKFLFRKDKKIEEVLTGVSAGGELVRNGKLNTNGMAISPKSKQPRSALGINKNKDKIILIAVDGRGRSVGATHNEMAKLLLEYGAYDGIHLDGGGSTTMALREPKNNTVSIVNNVSEKSPRSVPNAIGVKALNPVSEPISLVLSIDKKDADAIVSQETYTLKAYGIDENQNPVNVNIDDITFSFEDYNNGAVIDNRFIANETGNMTINAISSNGATGSLDINVKDPYIYLDIKSEKNSLSLNEKTTFNITALNKEGFSKAIDVKDVSLSLANDEIGTLDGNTFTAKKEGLANIVAKYNGATASTTVAIGNTKYLAESFEKNKNMFMMYFPNDKTVTGGAGMVNSTAFDGENSLLLSYNFKENSNTPQASYVCFEKEPIILKNNPTSIEMQIKGDGSQNILKAVLKDKNGKQAIVPVLNDLTSTEWSTASVLVPKDMMHPISIDKLYVASLSTTEEESGVIYIDDITEVRERTDGGHTVNSYMDYLNKPVLDDNRKENDEDISVFGQTAIKPYTNSNKVLLDATAKMSNNARAIVFAGDTDLEGIDLKNAVSVQWKNEYTTTNTNNLSIINLATKNGNMRVESPNQWRWLQSYLKTKSKNNILINMDKNIWDKNNSLSGARENVLLHKILKQFVQDTGKNIIVVSAVSDKTSVYVKDGIRYITLNGLSSSSENDLNNYKYLRIRASENDLSYEIKNVY